MHTIDAASCDTTFLLLPSFKPSSRSNVKTISVSSPGLPGQRFITLYYALLRFITLYYALLRLNASFLITLADTGQTHPSPPNALLSHSPPGSSVKMHVSMDNFGQNVVQYRQSQDRSKSRRLIPLECHIL